MKWRYWLDNWQTSHRKIKADFAPCDGDREAAREYYVERLTRIPTQALPEDQGDRKETYTLFQLRREIFRRHRSAAAIGLESAETVQWELISRSQFHLISLQASPHSAKTS